MELRKTDRLTDRERDLMHRFLAQDDVPTPLQRAIDAYARNCGSHQDLAARTFAARDYVSSSRKRLSKALKEWDESQGAMT